MNEEKTLAIKTINEYFGTNNSELENLSTGYMGYVYGFHNKSGQFVIKLTSYIEEPDYDSESFDQRIYGARQSDYEAVYNLLKHHDIPAPELHFSQILQTQSGEKYFVRIQDRVKGFASTDNSGFILGELKEKGYDLKEYMRFLGEMDAKMHLITRQFDGWVGMTKPYMVSHKDAFFGAFTESLDAMEPKNEYIRINRSKIQEVIDSFKEKWVEPQNFVLSPNGLFQGMIEFKDNKWQLNGIIDIEDYHLIDQRFSICSFDMHWDEFPPEIFQEYFIGYKKTGAIDPNYESLKDIYVLYYLLNWMNGQINPAREALPNAEEVIKYFEGEIEGHCERVIKRKI